MHLLNNTLCDSTPTVDGKDDDRRPVIDFTLKKKQQVSKDQVHVHIPSKHLEKVFPQGTSAVLDAVIDQHVSMSEGFINKESHISQTKWLFIVLALKKYILANSPTVKGTTCLYDSGLAGWKLPAGIDLSAL